MSRNATATWKQNRDRYWACERGHRTRFRRRCIAALYYFYHRVRRLWKIRHGLGWLHVAYVASLLVLAFLVSKASIDVVAQQVIRQGPAKELAGSIGAQVHESQVVDSDPDPTATDREWSHLWQVWIAAICSVVILLYRVQLSRVDGRPGETYRRERVGRLVRAAHERATAGATVMTRLNDEMKNGTQCTLERLEELVTEARENMHNSEARLNEVCECVNKDVADLFQEPPEDISVVVIRPVAEQAGASYQDIEAVGRKGPPRQGAWLPDGTRRPISESYAYEVIRLDQTIVFHDLTEKNFQKVFTPAHGPYLTAYCSPIMKPGAKEPCAVLTIRFKAKYLLWPLSQNRLDERLGMYMDLIALFLPEPSYDNGSESQS